MSELQQSFSWIGPSSDPNDEQVGDLVTPASLEEAADAEIVLVGEPYDGAVVSRQGAREGPGAIRSALADTMAASLDGDAVPAIADLGDVVFERGPVADVHEQFETVAAQVHDLEAFPVFLGGDNSVSVPNVGPLVEDGRTAVINFDAHLDCRAVHEEPTSGTPYRQLLDRGLADYVVVGARDFETSDAYVSYVREQGGTVIPAAAVAEKGIAVIEDVLAAIGEDYDHLYLDVDVDVLDASIATGVSAPTPGGLSARELYALLDELPRRVELSAAGIVECAPPLDHTNRTATAASRAVAHLLAGHAAGQVDRG